MDEKLLEDKGGERFSVVAGSNEDDDDVETEDECNTVEVSGFVESTTDDTLKYYFSNPKKGGGDIESFEVDKEEMKAYITFKNKKGKVFVSLPDL